MKQWTDYWNSKRKQYEDDYKEFQQQLKEIKEVAEETDLSMPNFEVEFRPSVVLQRDREGLLSIWHNTYKGYLCSMFWSTFPGGHALLNKDGSVSYRETNTWRIKENVIVDKEYYLGIIHNEKGDVEFRLVESPDYEAAEYLPFRSVKEYLKYEQEFDY